MALVNVARIDADGNNRTPILPSFALNVPRLLEERQPDFLEIGRAVQEMLAGH